MHKGSNELRGCSSITSVGLGLSQNIDTADTLDTNADMMTL